ncbi:MAG: single-stranded DNA-binding protein [Bacteroidales bacterium]|nr:single-stranded DNA-binding protein [Bacteroidales bacterium]MCB9013154.1 single-stranded DNA-binding protein [Bacteroidales bacterium]
MKNGINKVTLVGNVGEAPKYIQLENNQVKANFSLATNEHYTDKEGKEVKKTEWHKIIVWNKKAELVKNYVKKGDPLFIEGKIQSSNWEDKEGNKHYSTEIYCDNIMFLSPRSDKE